MTKKYLVYFTFFIGIIAGGTRAQQTTLTLKAAVDSAMANYGTIKAKASYLNASKAMLQGARREYLPDLSLSGQQDFGSINGQSGPLYGFRGLAINSGGPAMESQNWKGAFGALYLVNLDWNFFSFGRVRERINISKLMVTRDEYDLEQEKFQHQVRVAGAYLNLLAAQRLTRSQQNNLNRASGLRDVVVNLTKNGLNAGVDSSLANAEVSSAKIELVRAKDFEQEQANQLALFMGVYQQDFALDSLFLTRIPSAISDSVTVSSEGHPTLRFFKSLVNVSDVQTRYYKTLNYPTFSLFSVVQGRGSGFNYNYGSQYPEAYSSHYWGGVKPTRGNYLAGIGVIWNLTTPLRNQQQIAAQKFTSRALSSEFDLAENQIRNQLLLAQNKIRNAMANYREAPIQVKAAQDAYLQKSVLYKNGLSNIVDVTQALYTLNRAETDRDIAFGNVWQALLLKAAASGDFGIFINEF